MDEDKIDKLGKTFIKKLDAFLINSEEWEEEEEPMTENEIIQELSIIVKEITKHRIAIRDLENKLYKLENLLKLQ